MTAQTVLAEFKALGIHVELRGNGSLYVAPKKCLTPELIEDVRQHKAELIALLALERLRRLKGYTLPDGRMHVARELAERTRFLTEPGAILVALQDFERELISLGGEHDPELSEAVALVEPAFPGTQLVKFTRSKQ